MALQLATALPRWLKGHAGYGGPFSADDKLPIIKAIVGADEGAIFDIASAFYRGAIWEDSTRTTLASIDGPVGSLQDELGRYYAEQVTSGARPTLRTDGAGHYWLEGVGTHYMSITLNTPIMTQVFIESSTRPDYPGSGAHVVLGCRQEDASRGGSVQYYGLNCPHVQYRAVDGTTPVRASSSLTIDDVDTVGMSTIDGVDAWTQKDNETPSEGELPVAPADGDNTTWGLFTFFPNSAAPTSPALTMAGRIYTALISAHLPTDEEKNIVREWAASRCEDNPL